MVKERRRMVAETTTPRNVTFRAVDRGRIRMAIAAYELLAFDDTVVLHIPVGSPKFSRDGVRDGPRGGFLRQENYESTFSEGAWRGLDVVMVHRRGNAWSTWRWIEDGRWTDHFYVNLEDPWRSSDIGWDSMDRTLDVVVHADRTLSFKDENELDWAESVGEYSTDEADHIRHVGQRAHDHFAVGGWPLEADWDAWKPGAGVTLPQLDVRWSQHLPSG